MTIKRLRKEQGLTQKALAKRTGVTREYIARLELGRHDPMFSTLVETRQGAQGVGDGVAGVTLFNWKGACLATTLPARVRRSRLLAMAGGE